MEELKLNSSVAGKYKLTVRKPDGEVRLETDWFDNLITNKGLDNYFASGISSVMTYCHVGSGTSTPTVTQTSLDNRIMSTSTRSSSTQSANGSAPYESTSIATYRFAAVGGATNISEIGVSPSTDNLGASLTSRALILDVSGSPITISLNTGEVLDATYALSMYPSLYAGDYSHTAVISGNTYTFTWRAGSVGNPRFWNPEGGMGSTAMASTVANTGLTAITSVPYAGVYSQATIGSYTNGNYYNTLSYFFDLNDGNFANGINAIGIGGGNGFGAPSVFTYQCGVSPSIPKLSTQTLSYTVNASISRY